MKLHLDESEVLIILSFLLGKLAGILTVGHWTAVGHHWQSLVYSAIILPVLFVLMNTYHDFRQARRA